MRLMAICSEDSIQAMTEYETEETNCMGNNGFCHVISENNTTHTAFTCIDQSAVCSGPNDW